MPVQFRPRPLSDIEPTRRKDVYRIMTVAFHNQWLLDPEEAEAAWIAANGESEEWVKLSGTDDDTIWSALAPYLIK